MTYTDQFRKIDPYDWFCGPRSHIQSQVSAGFEHFSSNQNSEWALSVYNPYFASRSESTACEYDENKWQQTPVLQNPDPEKSCAADDDKWWTQHSRDALSGFDPLCAAQRHQSTAHTGPGLGLLAPGPPEHWALPAPAWRVWNWHD